MRCCVVGGVRDAVGGDGGGHLAVGAGVMVKVKFWLADEWARLEAVPPVAEMSPRVKVVGSIGLPKSTVTVTDAALVGEVASVDRVGPALYCRR